MFRVGSSFPGHVERGRCFFGRVVDPLCLLRRLLRRRRGRLPLIGKEQALWRLVLPSQASEPLPDRFGRQPQTAADRPIPQAFSLEAEDRPVPHPAVRLSRPRSARSSSVVTESLKPSLGKAILKAAQGSSGVTEAARYVVLVGVARIDEHDHGVGLSHPIADGVMMDDHATDRDDATAIVRTDQNLLVDDDRTRGGLRPRKQFSLGNHGRGACRPGRAGKADSFWSPPPKRLPEQAASWKAPTRIDVALSSLANQSSGSNGAQTQASAAKKRTVFGPPPCPLPTAELLTWRAPCQEVWLSGARNIERMSLPTFAREGEILVQLTTGAIDARRHLVERGTDRLTVDMLQ